MDNLQDVRIAGRDYSSMAIAIIILSGIHVILSLVFSVMAYRKGLRKEGGAWLLSFGVCVAILVLAAVATGQKEKFGTTNKPIIYYSFPGQGPCKLTRLKENEPYFSLFMPRDSLSKTYVSDIYHNGIDISSLGNTETLFDCLKNKKNIPIDMCIVENSAGREVIMKNEFEMNKIKKELPQDFGNASISLQFEKDGKKYMVRGVRQSLTSNWEGYTFLIKLFDLIDTKSTDIHHQKPSMKEPHFHNKPRPFGKIIKQHDLPNQIIVNTWVYKEYLPCAGFCIGAAIAGAVGGGIAAAVTGSSAGTTGRDVSQGIDQGIHDAGTISGSVSAGGITGSVPIVKQ